MEKLKEYDLYSFNMRKLIKSSQNHTKPFSISILDSKLFHQKPQTTSNFTKKQAKFTNDVISLDSLNDNLQNKLNTSLSQSILNLNTDDKNIRISPLISKFNLKRKSIISPHLPNITNSSPKSKNNYFLIEENDNNLNYDKSKDCIKNYNKSENSLFVFKRTIIKSPFDYKDVKKYTPYKISLKFRKNFEPKVDGKYDIPYSLMKR